MIEIAILIRAARQGIILLLLVSLSTLLSSCGDVEEPQLEPSGTEEILIKLSRTQCYGTCPSYTVEVTSSGKVRFNGYQFFKSTGLHSWNIPPEKVQALADEIVSAGFMELTQKEVDECPERWTDSPTYLLTVQVGEAESTIEHYSGCWGKTIYQGAKKGSV